jgi:hypothetical protein
MAKRLECDIVMSGGIASGIVYTGAIRKLAEIYDFKRIGGSSAGAIAAAWTAAASLAKLHNPNPTEDPFQTKIKQHPEDLAVEIGGKTVYERLFQPQPGTQSLFVFAMAPNKLRGLFTAYLPLALLGLAVPFGLLLSSSLTRGISGWTFWALIIACLLLVLLLPLSLAILGFLRDIFWKLTPENGYGLCSGSNKDSVGSAGVNALTDWMNEFIQDLAPKKRNDQGILVDRLDTQPVTFGDLWDNGGDEHALRAIDLQLMTTDITRGLSRCLPFLEDHRGQLIFKKDELDRLFPASIVAWMVKHAQSKRCQDIDLTEYFGLPKPVDLPILFGARMSASLPFLLSAIPLYTVRLTERGDTKIERCWFSDGGITSNFPIQFFDAPLPARPTFGINLVSSHVALAELEEKKGGKLKWKSGLGGELTKLDVWMPTENLTRIARFYAQEERGPDRKSHDGPVDFGIAIANTALGWADTELMDMPAYRDRIVHVRIKENEGGFNLGMKKDVIKKLRDRGECVGELLTARFAPNSGKRLQPMELTWDNHRWVRYRSMMAALEVLGRRFQAAWNRNREYENLLLRSKNTPKSYPLTSDQYKFAATATKDFIGLVHGWTKDVQSFDSDNTGRSPRPKTALRMMPR